MNSFNLNQREFDRFYETVKKAYLKIFRRCGLTAKVTEASGGDFSEKISYEFMVLTNAGEDDILYCNNCEHCINLDIAKLKKGDFCPKCQKGVLKQARASEVGNVFDLGQKYTKDFDFYVLNNEGRKIYPIMGCYGIGTTRLMGIIVEKSSDERGIIWPKSVAPFNVHLIDIQLNRKAQEVYRELKEHGVEVFWDDRNNVSIGEKFADADLIGIPVRLVVSSQTKDKIEWKNRTSEKKEFLAIKEVIDRLQK